MQQVVTNSVEGGLHRQTYADTLHRATKLASKLRDNGVALGDRIGTLAWNTYRHLEVWYGVAGQGAICHTINPRLFPDQIEYIVNHAGNKMIFVDLSFVDLLGSLLPKMPSVTAVVVMTDRKHMPDTSSWPVAAVHCYEEYVAEGSDEFEWPEFDERTCSSLCYTSGTTGNPRGVTYTHRANLLHAWSGMAAESFNVDSLDSLLMVVPMFHANSWGIAYSAPIAGSKLVLPGPHMDGKSIHDISGGEWISSADLENAAVAHPAIENAACIGATHPKWDERPILLIEPAAGTEAPSQEEVVALLARSFANWQLPDAVIVVDEIPLTATGKIDKKPLRAAYRDYLT
jgi:fatty-acyl-CoA synthase